MLRINRKKLCICVDANIIIFIFIVLGVNGPLISFFKDHTYVIFHLQFPVMERVVKNVKSASTLALETTTARASPVTMVMIVKVQYCQTLMHSS